MLPIRYPSSMDPARFSGRMHDLDEPLMNPAPRTDWNLNDVAWVYDQKNKGLLAGPVTWLNDTKTYASVMDVCGDVHGNGSAGCDTRELFSTMDGILAALFRPDAETADDKDAPEETPPDAKANPADRGPEYLLTVRAGKFIRVTRLAVSDEERTYVLSANLRTSPGTDGTTLVTVRNAYVSSVHAVGQATARTGNVPTAWDLLGRCLDPAGGMTLSAYATYGDGSPATDLSLENASLRYPDGPGLPETHDFTVNPMRIRPFPDHAPFSN